MWPAFVIFIASHDCLLLWPTTMLSQVYTSLRSSLNNEHIPCTFCKAMNCAVLQHHDIAQDQPA